MKKNKSIIKLFLGSATVLSVFSVVCSAMASAQGGRGWTQRRVAHRGDQTQFILGICVGRLLDQQGITIPVPQPGEATTELDSSTEASLQDAIQSCRDEMSGASPAPSVSPSATPTSS
jgi:hypothetical protein